MIAIHSWLIELKVEIEEIIQVTSSNKSTLMKLMNNVDIWLNCHWTFPLFLNNCVFLVCFGTRYSCYMRRMNIHEWLCTSHRCMYSCSNNIDQVWHTWTAQLRKQLFCPGPLRSPFVSIKWYCWFDGGAE